MRILTSLNDLNDITNILLSAFLVDFNLREIYLKYLFTYLSIYLVQLGEEQRKRERERESQADSTLSAQSLMWAWIPRTVRS